MQSRRNACDISSEMFFRLSLVITTAAGETGAVLMLGAMLGADLVRLMLRLRNRSLLSILPKRLLLLHLLLLRLSP